jgi:hypothetical protein
MRCVQSEFHFRHALFALQGSDGYVEAIMESARDKRAARTAAIAFARPRSRRAEADARSTARAR